MLLHWTSVDTRNAIVCAAVPSISAFVGTMMTIKDQELLQFLKKQNFHPLVCRSKYAYLVANTGVVIPFGYASYLLYKIGGGLDYTDTTISLALYVATLFSGSLYVATLLSGCMLVPTFKMKNIKKLSVHTAVLSGLSIATTVSFYTIDKISAYWTMPFTLWTLFCAGLTAKACCTGTGGEAPLDDPSKLTIYVKETKNAETIVMSDKAVLTLTLKLNLKTEPSTGEEENKTHPSKGPFSDAAVTEKIVSV